MPLAKDHDFYSVLGIPPDCGADGMRAAYLRLALRYHPDRNPGDRASEERFKTVSQAYAVLRDPAARTRYDRLLAKKRGKIKPRGRPKAGAGSPQGPVAAQRPAPGRPQGAGAAQEPGAGAAPAAGRPPKGPGGQSSAAPGSGAAGGPSAARAAGDHSASSARPGGPSRGGAPWPPPGAAAGQAAAGGPRAAPQASAKGAGAAGRPGAPPPPPDASGSRTEAYDVFGRAIPASGAREGAGRQGPGSQPRAPGAGARDSGKAKGTSRKPPREDPEDIILTFFTTPDGKVSLRKIKEELTKSGLGAQSPVLDRLDERSGPRPFWAPLKAAATRGFSRIKRRILSNPLSPERRGKITGEDLVFALALSPEAAESGTTVEVQYYQDGRDRKLSVRVPPGSRDGARLRLAGQGNLKPGGKSRGDLLLDLTVPKDAGLKTRPSGA
jgi:curved DNA-binding protein CbpA